MKTKSKPKASAKPTKRPKPVRVEATHEVLTPVEAASLLKVSVDAVKAEAVAGRLPGRSIGGEWRFSRAAVLDWLKRPADPLGRGGQVNGTAPAPEFVETPEEFAAFLAHIEAARDEEDRLHGFGKYAPE